MIEEWKEETISLSRKQKSLRSFGKEDAESFKEKILSERAKAEATQAAEANTTTPNQQMIDEPEGEEETKQEQPPVQSEDTNMHDVPNEIVLN